MRWVRLLAVIAIDTLAQGIFNKNCAISYPNYKFSFTIWALGKAYRELGDIEW